jgi:hypothetical protein
MSRWLSPRTWIVFGILAALLRVRWLFTYVAFFHEEPAPYFANDEEHFLYGSVGTEAQEGIPYWIWLVLPRIFPSTCRAPAATRRSACSAQRTRDADRAVEGHRRFPTGGDQLRDLPHRQRASDARRGADDLCGGAVAPDGAADVPALPDRVRLRSAVHGRHHPRRDRQEHDDVRRSIG